MLNTFRIQKQQNFIQKRNHIRNRHKNPEVNEAASIRFNPWSQEASKTFTDLQNSRTSPFMTPPFQSNFSFYAPLHQQTSKKESLLASEERYNSGMKTLKKFHERKIKKMNEDQTTKFHSMAKTVSIHNFEGSKLFSSVNSFQKKQKSLQLQQRKQKTTINNPMYLRFCNTVCSERPRANSNKEKISTNILPLTQTGIQYQNGLQQRIRLHIPIFQQIDHKVETKRSKDIHEIRRRLKSTSEMRKHNSSSLSKAFENSPEQKKQITEKPIKIQQKGGYPKLRRLTKSNSLCCSQKQNGNKIMVESERKQIKRKNLYIGYKKFFNATQQTISKQKRRENFIVKQVGRKEIKNIRSLEKVQSTNIIRKYETLQQYVKNS